VQFLTKNSRLYYQLSDTPKMKKFARWLYISTFFRNNAGRMMIFYESCRCKIECIKFNFELHVADTLVRRGGFFASLPPSHCHVLFGKLSALHSAGIMIKPPLPQSHQARGLQADSISWNPGNVRVIFQKRDNYCTIVMPPHWGSSGKCSKVFLLLLPTYILGALILLKGHPQKIWR